MNNENFFRMVEIIKKYAEPDGLSFHCEKETLYIKVEYAKIKAEDLKLLHALGCVKADIYLKTFLCS